MYNVMVAGAGKIGRLIACLLDTSNDYQVHLIDLNLDNVEIARLTQVAPKIKTAILNVEDELSLQKYLEQHQIIAVISSLPYFLNTPVARAAKQAKSHYFDLTEDVAATQEIKKIAANAQTAFVPQCGLAPGVISIAANSLMQEFEVCYNAKLRVGALPQYSNNALHYSLTWSTDGLINEYGNRCEAIEYGAVVSHAPLEGLEIIEIDGAQYEAFNTSGGLGSLGALYKDKIQTLNYKTIRYPGHCDKMRFLMNDLMLNKDRKTLKTILERVIPKTLDDVVITYVSVDGLLDGEYKEKSFVKKIYPTEIAGLRWSAIQISTAGGVCAVVDLILGQVNEHRGLVLQEKIALKEILTNRFGCYYV